LLAADPNASWYRGTPTQRAVWGPSGKYVEIEQPAGIIVLDARKSAPGAELHRTSTAGLIDLGDGIACVEFRSKMNTLDAGVVQMLREAPQLLADRGDFRGLVIGNQADNFSVGADAFSILALAGQAKWKELEAVVAQFQATMMGLRHGPIPVVAAPHGLTLGGGCELSLHAAAMNAHAELYMGLVEAGIGLVPAGGGLKEVVRRASAWADQVGDGDAYPWLRRGFEAAAQAKVSTSAFEARNLGYVAPSDGIEFNKRRVIAAAKRRAIALAEAGWVAPDPNEPIRVLGAAAGANFLFGAKQFEWAGYASAHDRLVGEKIAHILSGGMRPVRSTVTATELLDLEREAFVSLCGEQKTRDRIAHTLSTGKPLRN
jgi:3-hydroxyacyl-CoA dehydrogenase